MTGVKLDLRFVHDLTTGKSQANALSSGLSGLVKGMHPTGITEGIETEMQAHILRRQGWECGQGYYFARPAAIPVTDIFTGTTSTPEPSSVAQANRPEELLFGLTGLNSRHLVIRDGDHVPCPPQSPRSQENHMPDDINLLSVMPTPFLVVGGIVVVVVVAVFAIVIVKGVGAWSRNNASPVVTTMARIVTKRSEAYGGSGESSARTAYFATFETTAGERCELPVQARQSGLITEGDTGELTYQGTRFKGFARTSISSQ